MRDLALAGVVLMILFGVLYLAVRSWPPEESESNNADLLRGIKLGLLSTILLAAAWEISSYYPAIYPLQALPFRLWAVAGNVLNGIAGALCLERFNGQSLVTGILLLLTQLLWLLYALRVFLIDF